MTQVVSAKRKPTSPTQFHFRILAFICVTAFSFLAIFTNKTAKAEVSGGQAFTQEQRIDCQTNIEEIRWSHRIWPTENPAPKPSRAEVISNEKIRDKVDDVLRMEAALKSIYGVEITGAMLQTEITRMARSTRAPDRLQEIFNALANNPMTIAECLARPTLARKQLANAYAWDNRQHGDLRVKAKLALTDPNDSQLLTASGGQEHLVTLVRSSETGEEVPGVIMLGNDEFEQKATRYTSRATPGLRETEVAFVYEEILNQSENRLELRILVWPKTSFQTWWAARDIERIPQEQQALPSQLQLPLITGVTAGSPLESRGNIAANSWLIRPKSNVPQGRTDHTAVWTGSEMIIWGGRYYDGSTSHYLNSGGRYIPATDTWIPTSTNGAPSERRNHSAVWTGSEMVVWGGTTDGPGLNTGGRYSPATDSWTATGTTGVPSTRSDHSAVWTGNEMIIWGGITNIGISNTGGRYNPSTDLWVSTSTANAPSSRTRPKAVWTGSEMIVWGGGGGNFYFDTGGRYDPSTDTWIATSMTDAPSGRRDHTLVWSGAEMIVWGGYYFDGDGHYLNTGGRYDPQTDTWTATSITDVPSGRHNHTAVWTGDEMIVWGGLDLDTGYFDTGGRYNPGTDNWVATSTTDAPLGRSSHTGIWTGSEMIVWGGAARSDTGGRYDPSTDSWNATNLSETPGGRYYHSTVWTGNEMIVWGGYDGSYLNTGALYDPTFDLWIPTSTGTNTPAARRLHTAVWTGSRMIVWGGNDGADYLDTGGQYNPATDWWIITNTTGSPVKRQQHKAVWTGIEMIIWGGYDGTYLDTGGRYNPAISSWTATSDTGAPEGRRLHSAIWTGDEMIIWGGANTSTLDTGSRYDPLADTWLSTGDVGAPSARRVHTAIWTGDEMIVWGGIGTSYFDTGGRYDPVSNNWVATSTTGAPTGRYGQTAVWSGAEMIIWGGYYYSGGDFYVNTGGRYDPMSDEWLSTSTTNAPSGRRFHSAVWTGSEMMVWGGFPFEDSLGAYYPYDHYTTCTPFNLTIGPVLYTFGENITEQAEGTLDTIGDVVLLPGSTITFRSATSIGLSPDFRVSPDSTFSASISPVSCN